MLPATSNALRFEFAAPDYLDESALAYESQLQGLDTTWSAWAHEGRRDYTNLGFGNYQFRVRARNVLGQVSEEAAYSFVILPPWYRTWWAYGLYAVGLFLLAYLGLLVSNAPYLVPPSVTMTLRKSPQERRKADPRPSAVVIALMSR